MRGWGTRCCQCQALSRSEVLLRQAEVVLGCLIRKSVTVLSVTEQKVNGTTEREREKRRTDLGVGHVLEPDPRRLLLPFLDVQQPRELITQAGRWLLRGGRVVVFLVWFR